MKEPAYGGNLIFPWQKVYLPMSDKFTSVGVMGIMGVMGVMGVMGIMGIMGVIGVIGVIGVMGVMGRVGDSDTLVSGKI